MFFPQDSAVLSARNSVQEVVIQFGTSFVTTSGSTITIDIGQPLAAVVQATHYRDAPGTSVPVQFANRTISGNTTTLTLTAPFANHDVITLRYTTTY